MWLAGQGRGAEVISNSDCLDCHEAEPLPKNKGGPAKFTGVRSEYFKKSVHGGLNCVDCHTGITDIPHASKLPPPQCASCHAEEARQYATSIHGVSHMMGASGAATCTSCHGSHEIVPVKQLDSPVFKLNLPRTCGKCHDNPGLTEEYRLKYPQVADQFLDSIHGRALEQMGLIVAPSCNDCHGVHDIKRSIDRDSRTYHANVAKTCGTCHLGIEQIYNQSVHGQLLAKGDKRGPVCTDCHTAHQIEAPDQHQFQGPERPALRSVPSGPAGPLQRNLPRQGHGARPAQRRVRGRGLL